MKNFKNNLLGSWLIYSKTQLIAINALLCALILLFVLVPIQLGPFSLAVIPIIAVLISAQTLGLLNGMLTGLFFGLVSLINQFVHPGIFANMLIQNPLVTFLPRIMIGVTVFFVFKLFNYLQNKLKLEKKATLTMFDIVKYVVASIVGVCTNTIGFLGILYAFYHGTELNGGAILDGPFIWAIVLSNSLIELGVCAVVTPALVFAVDKTLNATMRKKKNIQKIETNANLDEVTNDNTDNIEE